MPTLVCYQCGKQITLAKMPSAERKCPRCGRKLHVCRNCQFFQVSGCLMRDAQPFTATHGAHCEKFQVKGMTAVPAGA